MSNWAERISKRPISVRLLAVLVTVLAAAAGVTVAFATLDSRSATADTLLPNGAIIDNGIDANGDEDTDDPGDLPAIVAMGINPEGHLNVIGGTLDGLSTTATTGLRSVATNGESTAPGCLCEGWGAADATSGVSGYANISTDGGTVGMALESFTASGVGTSSVSSDAPAGSPFNEATSVVIIGEETPGAVDLCQITNDGGSGGESAIALVIPTDSICNEDGTLNPDRLAAFLANQFEEGLTSTAFDICLMVPEICTDDVVDTDALAELLCVQYGICVADSEDFAAEICAEYGAFFGEPCDPSLPSQVNGFFLAYFGYGYMPPHPCDGQALCPTPGEVDPALLAEYLCSDLSFCDGVGPYSTEGLCLVLGLCAFVSPSSVMWAYCDAFGLCADSNIVPFNSEELCSELGLCEGQEGFDAAVEAHICVTHEFFCPRGPGIITDPILRVTHHYFPSPDSRNLYQVNVTIENLSDQPIDPRYRRVMDWDIPPTTFNEYSTIQGCCGNGNGDSSDDPVGAADNLIRTDLNGFDTANPLATFGSFGSGNFVDSGPGDIGALFDFKFPSLAPAESITFVTYYGAADTETQALAALATVGAEAYSFGQPSTGRTSGEPNTFIFAFGGIGGEVVVKQADVEAVSAEIVGDLPDEIGAGALLDFTVRNTVRNNGPYDESGLVITSVADTLTPPADCTPRFRATESFFDVFTELPEGYPNSFFDVFVGDLKQNVGTPAVGSAITGMPGQTMTLEMNVPLASGVDVQVDSYWSISCTNPSNHTFGLAKAVAVNDLPDVTDPDLDNNDASAQFSVAIIASADVEAVSMEVTGITADLKVGDEAVINITQEVRNNGPWDPTGEVVVAVVDTLDAPVACAPVFHVTPALLALIDPNTLQVKVGSLILATGPAPGTSWSGSAGDALSVHFRLLLSAGELAGLPTLWSASCSEAGVHAFAVSKQVTLLADEHVIDPNAGNDARLLGFDLTVTDEVVEEPRNITGNVVLTSLKSAYSETPEANAPGGVLTITAKWRNNSPDTFFDVFFDVTTLTGPACPCVLLNADGGLGGVGADRSVPNAELPGADNLWQTDEVTGEITFRLGLTVRKPVTFFVDIWATVAAE